MRDCPECSARWSDETRFCGACGTPLETEKTWWGESVVGSTVRAPLPPLQPDVAPQPPITTAPLPTLTPQPMPQATGGWSMPAAAPAAAPTPVFAPAAPPGITITPRSVVALFGAAGVITASLLNWYRGSGANSNSFKQVTAVELFNWNSTAVNPKLGPFLIGLAVLCVITALTRGNPALFLICGILAAGAGILFMAEAAHTLNTFRASGSFTDVVGPGAWVLAITGATLLLAPVVTPSSSRS